jgi:2-phosphoglycerate kinase
MPEDERPWDVLLIGGPSGAGKTSVSYPLARRFGVALTEVDDMHITALSLTTPEQQPALHYWFTHPEADELPPEKILELLLDVCRVLQPAVKAVIENHLEMEMPVVLEGDYILPEILAGDPWRGRVRGVIVYEPDEDAIVRNLAAREPHAGEQTKRAHVSRLHGEWLREECARYGVPAVPCRPWDSAVERVIAAADEV